MQDLGQSLIESLSPEFQHSARQLIATSNLPKRLNRIVPKKTLSISVSGRECEQNCSHCNGHYLRGMQPISKIAEIDFANYNSVLISGGSSKSGKVKLAEVATTLLDLPKHLIFNVHPGFQSPENLHFLKSRQTVVSFDLPSSDRVIRDVFRLPYTQKDYQELFVAFSRDFRTIPHITIGLEGPDCLSESGCIDFLVKQNPEEVVFIVFRPTQNTELANQPSPRIEKVVQVLREARERLDARILMGCMRPSGMYRQNLDILAWLSGIESFVQPDHVLLKTLIDFGIEINQKDSCCAL